MDHGPVPAAQVQDARVSVWRTNPPHHGGVGVQPGLKPGDAGRGERILPGMDVALIDPVPV